MNSVSISVSLTDASQVHQLVQLPDCINLIELRADTFAVNLAELKNVTETPLLFTLKSKREGGFFTGSPELRSRELVEAVNHYDFIDLEAERDLVPEILDRIPPHKRIISWQGITETYESLKTRFEKYKLTPAKYYRLVIQSVKSGDELPVLQLLNTQKRNDLIAYATGPVGLWTQPLSAFLGSPLVPSSLNGEINVNYFSPDQLVENYNLPGIYPVQKLFGIVGNPVFGSISPKLHNQAFRALGLPYLYLPFHANALQEFFDELINKNMLAIELSGLTVVSPFKEAGLKTAGKTNDCDVMVSKASNLMLKQHKTGWAAMSTDAMGVIEALNKLDTDWNLKNIVIIGCGGTGRTIAAALKRMKAKFTLVNRTTDKGLKIAKSLKRPFIPLDQFNPAAFDIIIHATPLGKNKGELPFDITQIKEGCIVIDHVYSIQEETGLVKYCRLCNIAVVDGVEMARIQIRQQFKLMTTREMVIGQKKIPLSKLR